MQSEVELQTGGSIGSEVGTDVIISPDGARTVFVSRGARRRAAAEDAPPRSADNLRTACHRKRSFAILFSADFHHSSRVDVSAWARAASALRSNSE
jgi:hypothetical protein